MQFDSYGEADRLPATYRPATDVRCRSVCENHSKMTECSFKERRKIMKNYIYKISEEERKGLYDDSFEDLKDKAKEYGLSLETVRECYAKAILRSKDEDGLLDDSKFHKELGNALSESRKLSRKRGQLKNTDWECPLNIYNGIVTHGIVNQKNIVHDSESIRFEEEGMVLPLMSWQDILILSGIYSLVSYKGMYAKTPRIDVTLDELAGVLLPKGKAPKGFEDTVNDCIGHFSKLVGVRDYKDRIYGDKTDLLYDGYFLDGCFDKGKASFSRIYDYMNLCNVQKRLVHIEGDELKKSRAWDEQIVRTYILWRKNSKGKNMRDCIRTDTLLMQTGLFPCNHSNCLIARVVDSIDGLRENGRSIEWDTQEQPSEPRKGSDHINDSKDGKSGSELK